MPGITPVEVLHSNGDLTLETTLTTSENMARTISRKRAKTQGRKGTEKKRGGSDWPERAIDSHISSSQLFFLCGFAPLRQRFSR